MLQLTELSHNVALLLAWQLVLATVSLPALRYRLQGGPKNGAIFCMP